MVASMGERALRTVGCAVALGLVLLTVVAAGCGSTAPSGIEGTAPSGIEGTTERRALDMTSVAEPSTPAPHVKVTVLNDTGVVGRTTSDDRGVFRVTLPPGEYVVMGPRSFGAGAAVKVEPGSYAFVTLTSVQ